MSEVRRSAQNLGERSELPGQDRKGEDVLERLLLDEGDVFEMLEEGERGFGDDVEDTHSGLRASKVRLISPKTKGWRTLRYSTKRARKAVKCSARRMLPGTASLRMSAGRTAV